MIAMAIGGRTATQLYEGEKKFDIRIRYQKEYRQSEDDIKQLRVPNIKGNKNTTQRNCRCTHADRAGICVPG